MSRSKAVLAILLVLGLGVFAAGCGGDDSSSQDEQIEQLEAQVEELQEQNAAEPEPSPEPPPEPEPAPEPTPDPGVVRGYEFFSSPTGNIGCSMADDGVRCDVRERSWSPPPKPGNCQLDWGQGVSVGSGEAGYVCAGDTTLGGTQVLQYGESSEVGGFVCESSEAGMRCENTGTGHGFDVSRSAVELF